MYRKGIASWRKHWDFMLMDFAVLQLSFILAFFYFRRGLIYLDLPMRRVAVTVVLAQVLVMLFSAPFKNILKRSSYQDFMQTFTYVIKVMLVELLILFVLHFVGDVSRLVTVLAFILYFFLTYLSRLALRKILNRVGRNRQGDRAVFVITTSDLADQILENFQGAAFRDMRITGLAIMDQGVSDVDYSEYHIPTYGVGEDLMAAICHGWVDEVFIYLPSTIEMPDDVLDEIYTMGITVHNCITAPDNAGKLYVERFGNYSVLTSSIKFVSNRQLVFKRIVDIIGGIVGCLVTFLIMIFIGPIIFIKSPGPIFFKQTRIGRNGKPFQMFKFRSMYMDAEARKAEYMAQNKIADGFMFKMDDDPRIIGSEKKDKNGNPKGIGNFIRNTSLDEFPQFLNVLKGDMSIVGTRPPTLDEWEKYGLEHRVRMSIKPGITGLWQISGRSKITDFDQVVRLDAEYIRNWTPMEDIEIILKTVGVVLRREGAE